jgi:CRP-like cAMP-binding protein
LIDGLETKRVLKDEYLIRQGEEGDYFYIIEEGSVACVKNGEDPNEQDILVRELSRGEHFGELALINDIKRTLSVKVTSDFCKVLSL